MGGRERKACWGNVTRRDEIWRLFWLLAPRPIPLLSRPVRQETNFGPLKIFWELRKSSHAVKIHRSYFFNLTFKFSFLFSFFSYQEVYKHLCCFLNNFGFCSYIEAFHVYVLFFLYLCISFLTYLRPIIGVPDLHHYRATSDILLHWSQVDPQ